MHHAAVALRVPRPPTVQDGAVVPHDAVARAPAVLEDERRLRGVLEQIAHEPAPFVDRHADDVRRV